MSKKVAVLAVNPVNGFGLFQYLESFFENKISYKVYAVSDSKNIHTNSGIAIQADEVIANLKGHAKEFDALVFSCGDAVPVFSENAMKSYNQDLFAVIKEFADEQKIMIGHCGAGLFFDMAGVAKGKKLTAHPYVLPAIKQGIATYQSAVVDGNFYTAQCEHTLNELIPELLKVLK